ncbi:hypothetical protein AB4455_06465 [Vibrio sp. 10N.261.46.E12]|uniref:hypothetical protein n=1 Tax=unclassified Vibrio TaxID=2614977 RepID=UPI0009779AE3|nr:MULTISPECIES: hypothetical protein [unclassified Vibrio]OMO37197.1 hypothetical protein BH584_23815 [Vibrio sp. 10N.261.45.E1]PMJ25770.1 hypothetical protein BCU27_09920 [Vibrio sp. 10N.286.45.B6]PML84435.1 hypothetical protein BCT66_17470 [Vibrio sp. 10N.261.49.E11]PMM90177.1 hypothetical protein BCT46_23715 [Vibrio sp. 10N.261.46.E8]PMN46140.1 hypothetical protein BCT32_11135 [Vibrio sp. 10N.261.45.E11]
MNYQTSIPLVVKATMTSDLEYKGTVTIQDLIEQHYLDESEVNNNDSIESAIKNYSKDLDGGEFIEKEGYSGSWTIDSVDFSIVDQFQTVSSPKVTQSLSKEINTRVSEKLVGAVSKEKYIEIGFQLTSGQYDGHRVSAIVCVGSTDALYVEIEVSDLDLKPIQNKGLGCSDVCNLHDQLIEFLESDLGFDSESNSYSNFETDIELSLSAAELAEISDDESEVTTYFGGESLMVSDCDLILVKRNLLDMPQHATGLFDPDLETTTYTKNFDSNLYIPAFWSGTADNYIIVEVN